MFESLKKKKGPREYRVPEGDNRKRLVCPECDYVAYDNPRIVVGAVVHHEGQVLLCRRAIEPRSGFWTIPAGFLELGETPEEGAKREANEEAEAELEISHLTAIYTVRKVSQVQLMYKASLKGGHFGVGEESLEVRLFDWGKIPWGELAFPTIDWALRHEMSLLETQTHQLDQRED